MTASCSSSNGERVAIPGAVDPTVVTTSPASVVTTTAAPVTIAPTPTTAPPTTAPATTAIPATTTAVPPTTAGPPTTPPSPDGPYYRAGDEGPEIAIIQLKLVTADFLEPGYTEGVFDLATNQAVLDFQGQYGLLVDGVVGPATERALTAAALSVDVED